MTEQFETKDSGKREQFASGMQRDTQENKTRFDLAFDGPLAAHLWTNVEKADVAELFAYWYEAAGDVIVAANVIQAIARYEGGMIALFQRYAELMTRGALKYSERNWQKAEGQAELDRFKSSAARHLCQWMSGNREEDHAAALIFNLNGAEYVRGKMGHA